MGAVPVDRDALAALAAEPRRRITVVDYHRMIEAGILGEDDRVELLEGVIVEMSPQSERHAQAIQRLTRILFRSLGEEYAIRPQLPLTFGENSEPEPDLAVLRAQDARSDQEHPTRALLVIEVAGESLRKDRAVKSNLYARFGVPEYWVVNLVERTIEVHRDPGADGHYRATTTATVGDYVEATSVPGVRVAVAELFG
ncbi:MAG TPA: Uma2 family endonuclease [Vicinamibacteria bacterium]|nr:Uma2 family endonuclease [Vicinamibacteria bacterium]